MRRRALAGPLAALLTLALLPGAAARPVAAARGAALPRVTLIGDSIVEPLLGDARAQELLGRGTELVLDIAVCRRVEQASCPDEYGVRQPNVVDVVRATGSRLGRTVIVAVGYNDFEQAYAHNVEDALEALRAVGVTHVLWPTLRAPRTPYPRMNGDLIAVAARHPELTVVDWDGYSRAHPEWFQEDELHLSGAGPQAFASLLHRALAELGIPLVVTRVAPASGPAAGRTRVTITGTGFATARSVRFGSAAATGVSVESPSSLTVTAPPGTSTVDVTVTTANGTSATSSAASYTYVPAQRCTVPPVVGKGLGAARGAIVAAHCSVGPVRRARSVRRRGLVVSQRPGAGAQRPSGSPVALVVSRGPRP